MGFPFIIYYFFFACEKDAWLLTAFFFVVRTKARAHSYFIHSGRKHKCEKNLNNENSKKAPRKKKKKKENDILSLCGKRKLYLTTDLDLLQNIFIKKTSAKQKVAFFLRANRFSKKSENIFSLVIKRLPRFNFFPSESGGRPRQLWKTSGGTAGKEINF